MCCLFRPENVPRLFDLIRVEDERIKAVFYFALHDTIVANDMDQATRIAFGKTRFRVVSLNGGVIEIAGTMSGGGKSQFRGKMGEKVKTKTTSSLNTSIGGNTTDDLEQIKQKAFDIQNEINHLQVLQGDKTKKINELNRLIPTKESNIKRMKTDIETFAHQIPALEEQLEEQRLVMEQTRSDLKKVAELQAKIADKKKIFDKCKNETKKLTDQIEAISTEIATITEDKIESVRKSIHTVENNIKKLTAQIRKLNVEITNAKRNLQTIEENIATMKADIEAAQNDLKDMDKQRDQYQNDIEEIDKRLKDIVKEISKTSSGSSEIEKEILALKKQESDLKLERIELEQLLQKMETTAQDLKQTIPHLKKQLEPLKLHKIPNEETTLPLKTYTDEELAGYSLNDIEYRIEVLEGELRAKTPNLNVIDEYQKKRDVYMDRIKVLEDITIKRNEMRKLFEDVKKRRYTEFMQGFSTITTQLRTMYQMITQGGDADLELSDSMDPFSEGITFSVRPPRKSWKNISNLSGGEKTLSSLALVFALHYYKPSPLYFMDEIDAALDFKNVSIVANYIKDRTKNAQFIIISLRSNMFELADYLTGIYKVDDCTDSITIENVPPRSIGSSQSQPFSSQRPTAEHFVSTESSAISQSAIASSGIY